MKHALVVTGLVAALFGCLLMLPLLAWASIQDPRFAGPSYVAAVRGALHHGRAAWGILAGVSAIVLGLAVVLSSAFLFDVDRHERRRAILAFWGALAVTSLAVLLLLVGVNYLRAG